MESSTQATSAAIRRAGRRSRAGVYATLRLASTKHMASRSGRAEIHVTVPGVTGDHAKSSAVSTAVA
jgi:hypothetical protein